MVPFLADALERILRTLMKYVIKKDVLDNCLTPFKLNKLDVLAEKHQRDAAEMRFPTEATTLIKNLSSGDRTVVAKAFLTMVTSTVGKLQERSRLKYQLIYERVDFILHNIGSKIFWYLYSTFFLGTFVSILFVEISCSFFTIITTYLKYINLLYTIIIGTNL